jgi:hypothetical protein
MGRRLRMAIPLALVLALALSPTAFAKEHKKDATSLLDSVVSDLANKVEKSNQDAKNTPTKVVDDVEITVAGLNNVISVVDRAVDQALQELQDPLGDGKRKPKSPTSSNRIRERKPQTSSDVLAARKRVSPFDSRTAPSDFAGSRYALTGASAGSSSENETGVLERIGDAALEAARRLAFPLALALIVAAFLAIQGRFDSRDPKLALAPVDAEQGHLSFR